MEISRELYDNYVAILKEELVPAMGCTEPIAIAYAAAKARDTLGSEPEKMNVTCSGNIVKNVKGVTVPNSGGQKGIEAAAALGVFGGDAAKELEVIAGATDEARKKARTFVKDGRCEVSLAEDVPNLYIKDTVARFSEASDSMSVTPLRVPPAFSIFSTTSRSMLSASAPG